ncbi:MAG: hypothetical protein R6X16_04240, partial [Anaerolineae bacterium]
MRTLRSLLLIIVLILTACLAGPEPAVADLGGSYVAFAGAVDDGAACYIPGTSQTLCFTTVMVTDDGEAGDWVYLKFPSDWSVMGYSELSGHPKIVSASCSKGRIHTDSLGVYWTGYGSGIYGLGHTRLPELSDICTATYCFTVTAGSTTTGDATDATVDWSWDGSEVDGKEVGEEPHQPCTATGWIPGHEYEDCDLVTEQVAATVTVCEHVTLDIQPETLPAATVGQPYSQQLTVLPNDVGPYSWTMTNRTLPDACSLNGNNGLLQCSADALAAGSYSFTAIVKGAAAVGPAGALHDGRKAVAAGGQGV